MVSDELVGKIARELNRKGWTCDGGLHEPGEYDTCADCRGLCKDMARAALAVVEAEQGWEYAIRAKEGIIAAGYESVAAAEFDAATATENPPGDLEVVRRHPASEWEACE